MNRKQHDIYHQGLIDYIIIVCTKKKLTLGHDWVYLDLVFSKFQSFFVGGER